MVDLADKSLMLMWPLFAPLAWTAVAKGLAYAPTGGSSTVAWRALQTSDRADRAKAARAESGEHGSPPRPTRPPRAERPRDRPSATGSAGHARTGHAHETSGLAGASSPGSMRRENGCRHPDRRRPALWGRWAPRSIRGQMTLLTAAMTALTLLPAGRGMYLLARAGTIRWRCDPCGAAGTGSARHLPACTAALSAGSRMVAEAGRPLQALARPGLLLPVSLGAAALIALNAWVTWKMSGWLLRPLERVGAEVSLVDFGHLSAGISAPRRAQEITRLSRAINQALGRLRKAKEELEEFACRQRQFALDVAHELRTPIAGLRVQLEAAQQDPGGVPLPTLLETTLGQVDRLQAITEDILCLARMPGCPPAEWRQLDLAALVEAEIARRADRHPVRLRITPGATVTAVPSQISRLLANLLNNAQRHSRRVVCVEVRAEPTAVEVAVSDDGPGIAEADRERVFQRFIRLDDARRLDRHGTGLGLAIARDIAQAHQGTLSVEESTVGGARFVLRLPRGRPNRTGSS
ncbi:cell wall metabolism sensor histidine kinase WalK [Microbispora sp. H11081]|uniref:sensor histidine kinase n=1 Tax=Microbispora sp. H11081 TaxID=2729107 RepID=UPI0014744D9F|nr:HAMP domain-containing sensor histidine kinase [Microbispora sp. H11081]